MISAIINTLNEEKNIGRAIRSVLPWVDEVIVADMYSEDQTRDLAASLGAKVILVPRMDLVEPAKALAVAEAANEWILIVDADEAISPSLGARLREIVVADLADAVRVPFDTYMFGDLVLHSGWSRHREIHLRFFKRNCVVLPTSTHVDVMVKDGARVLKLSPNGNAVFCHYSCTDWSHFLTKFDRYTSLEARHAAEAGKIPGGLAVSLKEFLLRYVRDGGWRHGRRGLLLSALMLCYKLLVREKYEVHARHPRGRVDILAAYDRYAERAADQS